MLEWINDPEHIDVDENDVEEEGLQSGASSQAKHGGAYFSAVTGSIQDPFFVPGRHEVPRV